MDLALDSDATAAGATAAGTDGGRIEGGGGGDEELLARAQRLISKISASQESPNPRHFHALASMLEAQEARYMRESASSSFNGGRSSHAIGRLANILHENDEFVVSLSTKFLSESGYPVSIRAAAARLLLSGSSTWMVFDDTAIENAKNWVMDDSLSVSEDDSLWKNEMGKDKPTNTEILKTYATGILAISLTGGGEIVEDMLNAGLSAKLMRFLRFRVLGDPNAAQKDSNLPSASKHASSTASARGREESRSRLRHVMDSSRLDGSRAGDDGSLRDLSSEKDRDRIHNNMETLESEAWGDGLSLRSEFTVPPTDKIDGDGGEADEHLQNKESLDAKSKYGERHMANWSVRGEDIDENNIDDASRRRLNRTLSRNRGKGRISEGPSEIERNIGLRITDVGQGISDQNLTKADEIRQAIDTNVCTGKADSDHSSVEEDDDRVSCTIGSRNISHLVKKALQAAEAEARTANAPVEAIKAAGDAAAELVRSSAMEAWNSTNDVEAVVLAASEAASTVINASVASEVSRTTAATEDPASVAKAKSEEEPEDFFILDVEPLAQLREKYCIQCLEILGEYVEALGPVLHEKGVDVCLALLQRSLKQEVSDSLALLPEVLKLICALAAHRKFASLFVDRSGMQKLLSVQRTEQTFFGLSSCLFTIGSLQAIMERVCCLPPAVVNQVVELALQLLECSQDQARKNAALFFTSAFVFRAVLDSFDAQDGLQKMLNLLHTAATVRSGGNSGTLGLSNAGFPNDRSPAEVLTASEKQIAYHTCVALRQYFRAHLLLLVDSLRPNKSSRSAARNSLISRAASKPLDVSNEAMDALFLQIQRDRKLGPAFVRARWPAVEKFLTSNGHVTMLELCQALPVERYLHDLAQYALGVLHIVTLVPNGRKLVVNASLSNDRVGMAVILDAANSAGFVDPEVIQPALEVLVNLVCPPPSISIKPSVTGTENRDRHSERSILDRNLTFPIRHELRDSTGDPNSTERGAATVAGLPTSASTSQSAPAISSGVVGDRRISLGPGAGCAGLAAQLEQGYRQAREAVRANNGIKVLLHLLHPRVVTPAMALDRIRALACRVLLGLARDDTIAHILTKLQVGKRLSELIRDSGSPSGTEQDRWQTELGQVAIELIAIVTNSGRASTLVATDAAAPTLRRIERAAIAAATPITYHSRELLLLILEHLQASGLTATASMLQREASLAPLPSLTAPQPPLHQTTVQDTPFAPLEWPSGRASCGFFTNVLKVNPPQEEDAGRKSALSLRKKKLLLSSSASFGKNQLCSNPSPISKTSGLQSPSAALDSPITSSALPSSKPNMDVDHHQNKTPLLLPMKRKLMEFKDIASPTKRLATGEVLQTPGFQTPVASRRSTLLMDSIGLSLPSSSQDQNHKPLVDNSDDLLGNSTPRSMMTPGLSHDPQLGNAERMTLDSLVVQYLKHQHRQCPAPITTLPPLSLMHPHVCPEPSRNLDAPANVTSRVNSREFRKIYGGVRARRRDRQFVYSRFKPCRTFRDDAAPLTCITLLGGSRFATGSRSGEIKLFDTNGVLESNLSHQSSVTLIQSAFSSETQLVLSSSSHDVKLWDASLISGGPLHSFEECKAARFSHSGNMFAALSTDMTRREILLYDIQKYEVDQRFHDNSSNAAQSRSNVQCLIHFDPLDTMLLWNGTLWDRRCSNPVHIFDQFSDYGGGGFHPAGNEVIINSEVWDLRKFKLLRSVPSLDQTFINFNSAGDVIFATLRRNLDDLKTAVNVRRVKHPLFAAFRTIDAVNYSDIATIPVDRCILDFASEPTNSIIGMVGLDDHDDLFSSARFYEIGRRRPTDDDSDPDDGAETDEDEEDEDDSEVDLDPILGPDLDGDVDSEADDMSNDDDVDSADELDDDVDFHIDGVDFDGRGILEIGTDGEDDDSDLLESMSDED